MPKIDELIVIFKMLKLVYRARDEEEEEENSSDEEEEGEENEDQPEATTGGDSNFLGGRHLSTSGRRFLRRVREA